MMNILRIHLDLTAEVFLDVPKLANNSLISKGPSQKKG
jgi:hypothetical protein